MNDEELNWVKLNWVAWWKRSLRREIWTKGKRFNALKLERGAVAMSMLKIFWIELYTGETEQRGQVVKPST